MAPELRSCIQKDIRILGHSQESYRYSVMGDGGVAFSNLRNLNILTNMHSQINVMIIMNIINSRFV